MTTKLNGAGVGVGEGVRVKVAVGIGVLVGVAVGGSGVSVGGWDQLFHSRSQDAHLRIRSVGESLRPPASRQHLRQQQDQNRHEPGKLHRKVPLRPAIPVGEVFRILFGRLVFEITAFHGIL